MKKIWKVLIVLLIVVTVGASCGAVYLFLNNRELQLKIENLKDKNEVLTEDNKTLKTQNDALIKEKNESDEAKKADELLATIPDGYTVYNLLVDMESSYGNSIRPDMMIDLYMKTTIEGNIVDTKFIENIKVLAVKDSAGNYVLSNSSSTPAYILFAVPNDIYSLLIRADSISEVSMYPAVKNDTSAYSEIRIVSQYLCDYINSKSVLVPED